MNCSCGSSAAPADRYPQTTDHSRYFLRLGQQFFKIRLAQNLRVECDIKLRTNFRAGGLSDNQEMVEVITAGSLKSLRYV